MRTKKRIELLEHLRNGGYLVSHVSGWHECQSKGGRKLTVETQDWLEATGELIEIKKQGKHIQSYRIYHKEKVPQNNSANLQNN